MEGPEELLRREEKFLEDFTAGRNKVYRGQGKKFEFRKLQKEDFERGLYECLGNLEPCEQVERERFEKRFELVDPKRSQVYKIVVGVDCDTDRIV
mmetsp:Transcript_30180/g.34555  ORF Transcript_30180/g.34555 Transcript_30180/m.34555 type:complete len:95 (+) Transcript_30180:19-303(+)|eukprot:CAMPEP_0168318756 /NCGR_PEP_ID=MMETSP0213-20121227/661_1 /TAXON_ID=151035 /ORGANISM="Euplotes harpa, Strain FSP1.4" /LENGTH=94 /DNA_ID=CAMNT_0008319869 /DNA_START=8 /DNA_END=292 /DNA_ORIENTATION=+